MLTPYLVFQTDGSFDLAEVGKLDLLCGVYISHELQVFWSGKNGIKSQL